ncbi:MAG: hypothetical protein ABH872_03160 [Candidatus Omnitrophota bacterium]
MRKFTKREKTVSFFIGFFILGALAFNFVISPMFSRIDEMNSEISKKTSLLKRSSRLLSKEEDISSVYDKYKSILEKDVSPDEVTADLYKEIESAAAGFDILIKKVKPLDLRQSGNFKEAALEVEVEGDFASIFQMVNKLENSVSLIKIVSFRLIAQPKSSKLLLCKLNIVRVFF